MGFKVNFNNDNDLFSPRAEKRMIIFLTIWFLLGAIAFIIVLNHDGYNYFLSVFSGKRSVVQKNQKNDQSQDNQDVLSDEEIKNIISKRSNETVYLSDSEIKRLISRKENKKSSLTDEEIKQIINREGGSNK